MCDITSLLVWQTRSESFIQLLTNWSFGFRDSKWLFRQVFFQICLDITLYFVLCNITFKNCISNKFLCFKLRLQLNFKLKMDGVFNNNNFVDSYDNNNNCTYFPGLWMPRKVSRRLHRNASQGLLDRGSTWGWLWGPAGHPKLPGHVEEEVGVRGRGLRRQGSGYPDVYGKHQRGLCQHADRNENLEFDLQVLSIISFRDTLAERFQSKLKIKWSKFPDYFSDTYKSEF